MMKMLFATMMLACAGFVMPALAADRPAPAGAGEVEATMSRLAEAAGVTQLANHIRKVRPGDRIRERGLGREGGGHASPGRWSCYGQGTRRTCTNRTWTCKYGVQRCWNKRTRRWHVMQNGRIGGVWTYRPRSRTTTRRTSPSGWSCYGQGNRRTCTNRTWTCKYGVQRCWNKRTRRWHVMQNGRIGGVWTRGYNRRRTYTRRRNNCLRVSTRTTLRYCQQICRRFGTTKCRRYVRWNKNTRVCTYVQGSC